MRQQAGNSGAFLNEARRRVAVVGLSSNVLRASHFVGFYAAHHGYRVIPVNPREEAVLGERSYPSLTDIEDPVDLVDVFRAPAAVSAIARHAKRVARRRHADWRRKLLGRHQQSVPSSRLNPNSPATFPCTSRIVRAVCNSFSKRTTCASSSRTLASSGLRAAGFAPRFFGASPRSEPSRRALRQHVRWEPAPRGGAAAPPRRAAYSGRLHRVSVADTRQ